eukprot:scaffold8227_cov32-Attheya_sp.AAC.1
MRIHRLSPSSPSPPPPPRPGLKTMVYTHLLRMCRYSSDSRRCDRAAAVTGGDGWVWVLLTFPLLKLQPLRGVGVGLTGKGGMVGSGTK